MITIITTVLGIFFKVAQFAAKIALNRTAVILSFVGTIFVTVSAIYDSLTDVDGVFSNAIGAIKSVNLSLGQWVDGNDYLQLIGYALSVENLVDGAVSTFIFILCTLSGFLLTALFGVFVAILPLLADLAVSALKHQMASSVSGLASK